MEVVFYPKHVSKSNDRDHSELANLSPVEVNSLSVYRILHEYESNLRNLVKSWPIAIVSLTTVVQLSMAEPPPDTGEPPADLQFKGAYETLARGDEARDRGRASEAARLYREALAAYMRLARKYPDWQTGVVNFRINYCNNQLEALMKKIDGSQPRPVDTPERDPGAGSNPTPGLQQIKTDARQFLIKGETEKARSLLGEGLRVNPDDTTLRLLVGIAQCQAGQFASASDLVKQILVESPSNACAHVVMGTIHFALGEKKGAEKELLCAIELNPNLKSAHYDLARLLLMATPPDPDRAKDHYRKAVQLGAVPDKNLELLLKDTPATPASPANTATNKPSQPTR
jgi:tetratricopeptide (TPR) repeat protein